MPFIRDDPDKNQKGQPPRNSSPNLDQTLKLLGEQAYLGPIGGEVCQWLAGVSMRHHYHPLPSMGNKWLLISDHSCSKQHLSIALSPPEYYP